MAQKTKKIRVGAYSINCTVFISNAAMKSAGVAEALKGATSMDLSAGTLQLVEIVEIV